MSIELANENKILGQVASNQGFTDLLDSTEAFDFSNLEEFFKQGHTRNIEECIAELRDLCKEADDDVSSTAENLADMMEGQTFVILTDGTSDPNPNKAAGASELEKKHHSAGVVMVPLTGAVIGLVKDIQEEVKEYVAAGGLSEFLHVTVRYGILDGVEDIVAYLSKQSVFDITFGKVSTFEPTVQSDGAVVLKVDVTSKALSRMNAEVAEYGGWKHANFDYHPHVTIAYIDSAADIDPIIEKWEDVFEGLAMSVDHLMVSMPTEDDGVEGEIVNLLPPANKLAKSAPPALTALQRRYKDKVQEQLGRVQKHLLSVLDEIEKETEDGQETVA